MHVGLLEVSRYLKMTKIEPWSKAKGIIANGNKVRGIKLVMKRETDD